MQDLAAIIETIPTFSWVALCGGPAVLAAIAGAPHLRQHFHIWRRDRLLARTGGITQDAMNVFDRQIGDDPEPINAVLLLREGLTNGAIAAGGIWFVSMDLERWWNVAFGTAIALSLLYSAWHRINDPEEPPLDFSPPSVEVPREAIMGLIGGIAFVGLALLLIVSI